MFLCFPVKLFSQLHAKCDIKKVYEDGENISKAQKMENFPHSPCVSVALKSMVLKITKSKACYYKFNRIFLIFCFLLFRFFIYKIINLLEMVLTL